jgi:molybdate transport system ATP-binding protein
MTLRADVATQAGALGVAAHLQVDAGQTVAVVGPNGAGKTTLLRAIAGLATLDRGRVELDGQVLEDTVQALRVPPERRPIGVVFQDYLLFPHLSSLDNVAYGLRSRGGTRREARALATQWLDRVGLSGQASARPHQLSGGQAQRVALARALARGPALLLLDEPLAAVDVAAKGELRRDLRRHLREYPGVRILITHDPVDAFVLADRITVLEHGAVTQQGSAADVAARPRSPWVADLLGLNLYQGQAADRRFAIASGGSLTVASDVRGSAFAAVHPHAVTVHRARPEGSARNVWPGRVTDLDPEGDRVRVRVGAAPPIVAEVTPAAAAELGLIDGGPVWVSLKATEISVYPA